jgi:hypothetical protein
MTKKLLQTTRSLFMTFSRLRMIVGSAKYAMYATRVASTSALHVRHRDQGWRKLKHQQLYQTLMVAHLLVHRDSYLEKRKWQ